MLTQLLLSVSSFDYEVKNKVLTEPSDFLSNENVFSHNLNAKEKLN
jgi:hypothetical protein